MKVVDVIEKHRELLDVSFDKETMTFLQKLFNSKLNVNILDKSLKLVFVIARNASASKKYEELDLLIKFILDSEIQNKEYFFKLLDYLNEQVNGTDITHFQKRELLLRIALSKDDKFNITIIEEIIKSHLDFTTYELLLRLFDSKLDIDKLIIIIKASLHSKIDYQRSLEELPYILTILNDELINSLDEVDYLTIVNLCFDNAKWYLIYRLLTSSLKSDKKRIALNYYLKILNSLSVHVNAFCEAELRVFDIDILTVIYNSELSNLDETEYKDVLEFISNSSNPSLIATLKNYNLSKEKEDIVSNLDLIRKGSDYLAKCAISPVLSKLCSVDYKELLEIVNYLIWKLNNTADEREKELLISKLDALVCLFNTSEYINHIFRLGYVISIVLNSNNLFSLNEIVSFASNCESFHYSDLEFKRAISILSDSSDIYKVHRLYDSKYFLYTGLFTNLNISFMDRNSLMDIALENDYNTILKLTRKLNELGRQNKNLSLLLGDTRETVIMGSSRIRELI